MVLQCWRTGEYIGGNMMQDLETDILLWHLLVPAILGLPELSPGLGTFQMQKTHGLSTSLAAWQCGIFNHEESDLLLSGIARPS